MDVESVAQSYPRSAQAVLLPIFASFAIAILIAPFIWHLRLQNTGACSLIIYLTLANLVTFINSIIWPTENYDTWWNGVGLCDIEVKLRWSYVTGIACSTLCITRNLANVLDVDRQVVFPSRASKRRQMMVDLAICCTVPLLEIALHYIIQPNRYLIAAIGGCTASYDNSWPTIIIIFIWPPILCLVTCYYAVAVIYRLRKHRSNFTAIITSSSTNLTTARFLRLFIMSFTLLLIYTPVSIFFLYVNLDIVWIPYDWNAIHDPEVWWDIIYVPPLGAATFDQWVSIAMAFFVFFYFGMGGDAVDIYRQWMLKIGLGRLFGCLNHPRRRGRNQGSSWSSRFSPIGRAKNYFDSTRKTSTTTTSQTKSYQASYSRKPSLATIEHQTSASSNPVPHLPFGQNTNPSTGSGSGSRKLFDVIPPILPNWGGETPPSQPRLAKLKCSIQEFLRLRSPTPSSSTYRTSTSPTQGSAKANGHEDEGNHLSSINLPGPQNLSVDLTTHIWSGTSTSRLGQMAGKESVHETLGEREVRVGTKIDWIESC